MRWACAGTILAGELALEHGLAVNMSGGYHHAKPDAGEGFCIYSDIGLLVDRLRHYFLTYKQGPDRVGHPVEITHVYGRDEAHEVIRCSQADYANHGEALRRSLLCLCHDGAALVQGALTALNTILAIWPRVALAPGRK